MSTTYKNVSSDYTITCNNGVGIFTVNAANTIFNGNLTYTGNLTTVDDFIVVAANNTGAITDMGLLAQTGPGTFAGLRYDTVVNNWQTSPNVTSLGAPITAYANIASGTIGGANTQIQFNDNGDYGGSANLTFDKTNNRLTLNGHQAYSNIGTTPTVVANSVTVYSKAQGSGGTGLYVVSSTVDDELVSKSKAIVFGIIF